MPKIQSYLSEGEMQRLRLYMTLHSLTEHKAVRKLLVKGLIGDEQGSGLEGGDESSAEATRGVPWKDVLRPEQPPEGKPSEPPFARKRRRR